MIKTTADLIAQVESNGNPYACRFEPAYTPRQWPAMARLANCSESTAKVLCAMSFGLYQIMGDNLIALGVTVSPLAYCADTNLQLATFNKFLDRNRINFSLDGLISYSINRETFSRAYNGPGNVAAYSQRILDIYMANMK